MVAPEVVSLMVTVCALVYVAPAGEKVGVAAVVLMVYAEVPVELETPETTAMAFSVSVALTVIGPE